MARRQGSLPLDAAVEPSFATSLDARQFVRTKEELLSEGSFEYGFNGLLVSVRDEQKVYMLIDKDNPTVEASWKEIGGSSGGSTDPVAWDDVQNKPTFATVATSGSYNDLSDQPTIPEAYDDTALAARVTALENAPSTAPTWNDVTGKPEFANVATSGSYNDLGDKPTIPEAYDDTEVRNLIAGKANTADLAPVATSGSYNDLGDKPTIPEAYDDTALAARVTALENAPAPVTSYNDLTDKPDLSVYLTEHQDISGKANTADLATVATSGSYNDLGDKPTIPEAYDDTALAARVTAVENGKANSADLAAVATSGSYNDLSDKPTIPAEVTVDSAMSDASENPVQNKVVLAAIGDAIDVVETAIADRYTKAETDTKIAEAIDDVNVEHFHTVTVLPAVADAEENHEYVLVTYEQDGTTIATEEHYLFYDGVFHSRPTRISLEGYATEVYVDAATGALDTRVTAVEDALNLTALTDEEIAALVP